MAFIQGGLAFACLAGWVLMAVLAILAAIGLVMPIGGAGFSGLGAAGALGALLAGFVFSCFTLLPGGLVFAFLTRQLVRGAPSGRRLSQAMAWLTVAVCAAAFAATIARVFIGSDRFISLFSGGRYYDLLIVVAVIPAVYPSSVLMLLRPRHGAVAFVALLALGAFVDVTFL